MGGPVRNIEWQGYGENNFTAMAILLTLAMVVMVFRSSRQRALLPILIVAFMIPQTVRIVLGGLDFPMLRLMVLAAGVRVLMRGELRFLPRFNAIDVAFCVWMLLGTTLHSLRDMSVGTLIYRIGFDADAVGLYVLVRLWLRTPDDLLQVARWCVPLLALIVFGMAIESLTAQNPWSILGANPDTCASATGAGASALSATIRKPEPAMSTSALNVCSVSSAPAYGTITPRVPAVISSITVL